MSALIYERVHDNLNRLKLTTFEALWITTSILLQRRNDQPSKSSIIFWIRK